MYKIYKPRIAILTALVWLGIVSFPLLTDVKTLAQTQEAIQRCTSSEINKYIRQLATIEATSFDALVECKSNAVPALIEILENNDEKTRILIISALGAIGEQAKPASERLSELLSQEKRRSVRVATVYTLTEIGKDGVPSVVSALQDSDWYIRSAAVDALGEIGASEAIPALNDALKDKDWYVSSRVMRAIDKISITKVRPFPPISTYRVKKITLSHFQMKELQLAIEADTNLSDEDKEEALKQVQTIAEVGQKPQEQGMQKIVKNALKFLKGTIADLPSTVELVQTCGKVFPLVTQFFGL